MTGSRDRLNRVMHWAWAGLLAIAVGNECLAAEGDAARDALSRQGFPWYDSQEDEYSPIRPLDTEEPRELEAGIGIPFAQILSWTLLGILIAIAVYFLIRWGIDRRTTEHVPAGDAAVVDVDRLEALPEAARQVRDLLGHARELAAQGRYSEAIVFLYGWQLVQLDRQRTIELQKGKTNHQYVDEVSGSRPEIDKLFMRSTRLFEDAFFGRIEISESAFRDVWQHNHVFGAPSAKEGSP